MRRLDDYGAALKATDCLDCLAQKPPATNWLQTDGQLSDQLMTYIY